MKIGKCIKPKVSYHILFHVAMFLIHNIYNFCFMKVYTKNLIYDMIRQKRRNNMTLDFNIFGVLVHLTNGFAWMFITLVSLIQFLLTMGILNLLKHIRN
jgi:uncharacterized membrane protein YjfL (UPF0719 family)